MLGVRCTSDILDSGEDSYLPANTITVNQALSARSSQPQIPSTIEHDFTILGSQQPDPYEKSNMIAAINETYGTTFTDIAPTHHIVKFTPQDYDQVALLDEWELDYGVPYFDIPFGYEVVQIGERYIDPSVTDSLLTPQYASVPVGTAMPAVPHTIQWSIILLPVHSPATYTAFYRAGYTGDNPNWDYDVYPGRSYFITDSLGYIIEQYPPTSAPPTGGPGGTGTTGNPPIGPPSGPPVPPVNPDCTPECENYPCCLEPLTPCGETDCNPDIPCNPSHPFWPDCMDPFAPTGSDDPLDTRSGPDYCECTFHIVNEGEPLEYDSLVYELAEGETCGDLMAEIAAENPKYINISCVNSTYTPPTPPENACGCPIPWDPQVPAGCVQMEADNGLFTIPVRNTSIRVRDRRFGGTDILPTDENGCWRHTKRFSNRMWMWNKFSNGNGKMRVARPGRPWQYISITSDYVGVFRDEYNRVLLQYSQEQAGPESQGRRYFLAAAMLVGLEDYYDICLANGIVFPRDRINMTGVVVDTASAGDGAPMLQQNIGTNLNIAYDFIQVLVFPNLGTAVLANYIVPDIMINLEEGETLLDELNTSIYHELGHASHHVLVGESYWNPYRQHIINNDQLLGDVYGGPDIFAPVSSPDIVALGEMWGFYVGNQFGLRPNFNIDRDGQFVRGWIPAGLPHDLIDNNADRILDPNSIANPATPLIFVTDQVSGFTIGQIFDAIRQGGESVDQFSIDLKALSLDHTVTIEQDYDDLIDVYNVR